MNIEQLKVYYLGWLGGVVLLNLLVGRPGAVQKPLSNDTLVLDTAV